MYQLVFKPRAISMVKEAYDWYEEQQTGLGELFLHELESCYDKLEAWPVSFTKIKKNYRHIIIRTFPYVIVYEVIQNDVVIYSVFHTSRSPRKKFKK